MLKRCNFSVDLMVPLLCGFSGSSEQTCRIKKVLLGDLHDFLFIEWNNGLSAYFLQHDFVNCIARRNNFSIADLFMSNGFEIGFLLSYTPFSLVAFSLVSRHPLQIISTSSYLFYFFFEWTSWYSHKFMQCICPNASLMGKQNYYIHVVAKWCRWIVTISICACRCMLWPKRWLFCFWYLDSLAMPLQWCHLFESTLHTWNKWHLLQTIPHISIYQIDGP